MTEYAAFIGHQPHISLAELSATVPNFSLIQNIDDQVIVFSSDDDELDTEFVDALGGTIVLAKKATDAAVTLNDIPKILVNELGSRRGKLTFSLRTVGVPKNEIKRLYRAGKDALKAAGKSCKYVGNEKKPAIPVVLHDSDMLSGKKGCEVVILQWHTSDDPDAEPERWVGITVGAHDVDYYSWLDMEKPVRDTTVGLLPPKLAQSMLNLSAWLVDDLQGDLPDVLTVYDPFCGTGVIPMECLLRGWDVLASDISQKAVNGCEKNLDWLRKEEKILKKEVQSTVWKHDVTKSFDLKEEPDVIVTETSLGPPLSKRGTVKDIQKNKREAEKLEEEFLTATAEAFPNTPVVCIFPAWRKKGGWERLEKIWEKLPEIGYTAVLPASIEPEDPKHFSLFYRRPDQFVGREIVLLRPRAS